MAVGSEVAEDVGCGLGVAATVGVGRRMIGTAVGLGAATGAAVGVGVLDHVAGVLSSMAGVAMEGLGCVWCGGGPESGVTHAVVPMAKIRRI